MRNFRMDYVVTEERHGSQKMTLLKIVCGVWKCGICSGCSQEDLSGEEKCSLPLWNLVVVFISSLSGIYFSVRKFHVVKHLNILQANRRHIGRCMI